MDEANYLLINKHFTGDSNKKENIDQPADAPTSASPFIKSFNEDV